MTDNSLNSSLLEVPIFQNLSAGCLARLSQITTLRHLDTDSVLFWEGDKPDYFYVIRQGRVKILKHSSQGKEMIISFFGPGDMIGEVAVFDDKPYPATAQAMETTDIIRIGRAKFLQIITDFPEITLGIIKALGARLRESQSRLRDMATERVEQRVARILLMLSEKLGDSLPFTRQEIADMTGTTTETAIRVLSQFNERGITASRRGHIIILDSVRLELLSQGPPQV